MYRRRPYIQGTIHVTGGPSIPFTALVDSGCESNLIRTGVVPPQFFHMAARPQKFMAANKIAVAGGQKEICLQITCDGVDMDTGLTIPYNLITHA